MQKQLSTTLRVTTGFGLRKTRSAPQHLLRPQIRPAHPYILFKPGHGTTTPAREARRRATSPAARFTVGDCLTDALPEHDLALLLLCDYCARSPADRAHLLARIREAMVPGAGSCSVTPRVPRSMRPP